MFYDVVTQASVPDSHVVVMAEGELDREEMRSAAIRHGDVYNVPNPRAQYITLNPGAPGKITKVLIVITSDGS